MSFFSGSSKALPAPAQKPLGLDETRASTNEQARPIPYVAGKTRIGITWICEAFNIRADAVSQSAGKGKSTVTGYNYFASLAALIAWGPLDGIHGIYLNSELVWEGTVTRGAEDYVDLTIDGYGTCRIYWGTGTQDADPELLDSGFDHPPYRYQAYLVFTGLFFGFNQTSAPNVEVVVSRYPVISWMTAAVAVQDDCNAVAVAAEWLQSARFGLGLPDAALATGELDAIAGDLEDEEFGVSPYVTRQINARQLLQQLVEYFDGYLLRTRDGKLSLGLIRTPVSPVSVAAVDLVDEPDLDPDTWKGVSSKTWVKYLNRDQQYKEAALPYRDAGVFGLVGENSPVTLERPWITRPAQAQQVVAASGRTNATPRTKGRLLVRKSSAAATEQPGAVLELDWDQTGISALLLRIISKSLPQPGAQQVALEVAVDRAYLNDSFYIPDDDVPPTPASIDPEPFVRQTVMELPLALSVDGGITLATLAARPNRYVTRYNTWLRNEAQYVNVQPRNLSAIGAGTTAAAYGSTPMVDKTAGLQVTIVTGGAAVTAAFAAGTLVVGVIDGSVVEYFSPFAMELVSGTTYRFLGVRARNLSGIRSHGSGQPVTFYQAATNQFTSSYSALGEHDGLAQRGVVADENYPASTDLVDDAVGMVVALDQADTTLESFTLDEALAQKFLLWVDQEIISVSTVTLLAAGKYRVHGVRARYDTRRQAHSIGAEVWLIERVKLQQLHDDQVFYFPGQPNFKLQPRSIGAWLDLADATPLDFAITNRAQKPLAPLNLAHASDGSNPHYTTGQDLVLTWNNSAAQRGGFWSLWGRPVTVDLPYTRLEFYTTGGVLKQAVETAAGAETHTYTNAALLAAFGTEQDVVVRAYGRHSDLLQSLAYDELTIELI